ncbi:xenobiotic-transporting atpase [Leptolyngbya sp. Heron Island J]|nr:xenobiotic-transporting atpase [Leptolyngbya sp. Heron Island J]
MSSPLLRLLHYGKPHQIEIWSAIACSILNTIFDLAPPYLIGIAIDVVVNPDSSLISQFGINSLTGQLAIVSGLTLLIWSLESLTEYGHSRLWRNLAQTLQHKLRVDAYSHLQNLELSYLEDRSTGLLLSILNDDINQLERFLNFGAYHILHFFTTILVVGTTFIILAPGVSVWAMLPIPFVLWGGMVFQTKLEPRYADVREKNGLISSRLTNNLPGMATIKSFTAEAYERERVIIESNAYRRSNAKAIALSTAFVPIIRIIILIGFTATLFLGGLAVANGRLSAGTYGFMVFISQRLLWPFTELGVIVDEYHRLIASVRRVMDLLDTPIAISHGSLSLPHKTIRGDVQFEHITFAYPGRSKILNQFSLHIPAESTIGIVGATGSGKSTLVKLLLRFYNIQQGRILIDGIDIRDLNLSDLRRHIGWVSQDVFLFHGTVAENIAYGSFEASQEQIVEAAKAAEAHEFIQQLPQGYNTIVGERGQKLSGGQRQRIAIARTILKNPPILVLDEATSAVDNETEAAIQKSLTKITQNRTTIAIAHRLSTIRHSDCIYVMDKGQLVEQGTHKQLQAQDGIYAKLWRVQSGLEWAEPLITSE